MKEIDLLKEDRHFSRYKGFFYGYCFFCSNFGHKTINYSLRFRYEQSIYSTNNHLPQQRSIQPSNKQPQTINHAMAGKRIQVKHKNSYEHNNRYDLLFSEPNVTSVITIDIKLQIVA
jgi:hypothetical protein